MATIPAHRIKILPAPHPTKMKVNFSPILLQQFGDRRDGPFFLHHYEENKTGRIGDFEAFVGQGSLICHREITRSSSRINSLNLFAI